MKSPKANARKLASAVSRLTKIVGPVQCGPNKVHLALDLPYLFNVFENAPQPLRTYETANALLEENPNLSTVYSLPMLKALTPEGFTVLRWYSPRTNSGWTMLVLEDCRAQFPKTKEVSLEDCRAADRYSAFPCRSINDAAGKFIELKDISAKQTEGIVDLQCPGCMHGPSFADGCDKARGTTRGCINQAPGTMGLGIGTFHLGAPKGFNRLGPRSEDAVSVPFEVYESNSDREADFALRGLTAALPAWIYLDRQGRTFMRWYLPETNQGWAMAILEDCTKYFPDTTKITEENIEYMD